MTGIELLTGTVEYIDGYMDAIDIIRKYVGDDLAEYCREQFEAADYETTLAQEKAKTDEEAVMDENSELRDTLQEVQNMVGEILDEYAECPKKPKYLIMEQLEKIEGFIQQNT